jgi:hypothetical protein
MFISMKRPFLLFFFLVFVLIVYIFYLTKRGIYIKPELTGAFIDQVTTAKKTILTDYTSNYYYTVNNNLAQYSVYLTKVSNDTYKIEAYVFFYFKNLVQHAKVENYLCLVKLLNVEGYREKHEVIEIKAVETYGYYFDANRKFLFKFKVNDFESYRIQPDNFNVDNIVVAVIHKDDYDKKLSEEDFDRKLLNNSEKFTLPYSLIIFQSVTYIDVNISKTVSCCVHFTYGRVPSNLKNWIDMHLEFGVAEIMFYDGTTDWNLTRYIKENFSNETKIKINVKPYRIGPNELCAYQSKTVFIKTKELLKKHCLSFHNSEFLNYVDGRSKHEQITSNDCITHFGKKHEYSTYYDLDEYVFPRAFNLTKFTCEDKNTLCSVGSFDMNKNNETSSYYRYLDALVDKYRHKRDKSTLAAIKFQHSAYLIHNYNIEKLFSDINFLIKNIGTFKTFPISLVFSDKSLKSSGHTFVIEYNDLDYLIFLDYSYNLMTKCILNNKLVYINNTLDINFQRFLYLITEPEQRWPKCILVGKNIEATFLHYPTHWIPGGWDFEPNPFDGHMLPHFRDNHDYIYNGNINGSIRKLNFDLEYLSFIITKFSNFCEIK